MLKGDTVLLPQKDAKTSGNPNSLFLVVNWRPVPFPSVFKIPCWIFICSCSGQASQIKDALDLCSTTRPPAITVGPSGP